LPSDTPGASADDVGSAASGASVVSVAVGAVVAEAVLTELAGMSQTQSRGNEPTVVKTSQVEFMCAV
jgi:hypothetical protein